MNKIKTYTAARWNAAKFAVAALMAGLLGTMGAFAAAADPDTVVTDATATFEAVTTLVVAIVVFFTLIAIVKKVRRGS